MIYDLSGQEIDSETAERLLRYGINPARVEDAYEANADFAIVEMLGRNAFLHADDPDAALEAHIRELVEKYS